MKTLQSDWRGENFHAENAGEPVLNCLDEVLLGLEFHGADFIPDLDVGLILLHTLRYVSLNFVLGKGHFLLCDFSGDIFFILPLLPLPGRLAILLPQRGRLLRELLGLSLQVALGVLHLAPAALLYPLLPLLGPRSGSGVISLQQVSPDNEARLPLLRPILDHLVNAVIPELSIFNICSIDGESKRSEDAIDYLT